MRIWNPKSDPFPDTIPFDPIPLFYDAMYDDNGVLVERDVDANDPTKIGLKSVNGHAPEPEPEVVVTTSKPKTSQSNAVIAEDRTPDLSEDWPGLKTIKDKFGIVIMEKAANGRWAKTERIAPDGTRFKITDPQSEDWLAAINSTGVTLALNEMNEELLINGQRLTDTKESVLFVDLRDRGMPGSENWMRHYMKVAADQNRFHPLLDYLDDLEWDGDDHIGNLLSHFNFDGDGEWEASVIKKWLVGSVAKLYEQAQLPMLCLEGPQRCGKSGFVKWLCPFDRYHSESPINPGSKDTEIESFNKWIWEVAELQATTRKADREALKAFITRKMVDVRVPYGRNSIQKPVTASYIGTLNPDAGFLEDDGGNRRFLIVAVKNIDWQGYTKALSPNKIWAQAVDLYKNGFDWNLTPEEEAIRDERNMNYDAVHPVIEMFLSYYDYTPGQEDGNFMSTMAMIKRLEDEGLKGTQWTNIKKLTSWLKGKGVEYGRDRVDGKQARGFFGVTPKATISWN